MLAIGSDSMTTTNVQIIENHFENTGGKIAGSIFTSTTNLIIARNVGFVTENSGLATNLSDGGTIAHGLDKTPTSVVLTSLTTTYYGELVLVYWNRPTTTSTNIVVNIYWVNETAVTDNAIDCMVRGIQTINALSYLRALAKVVFSIYWESDMLKRVLYSDARTVKKVIFVILFVSCRAGLALSCCDVVHIEGSSTIIPLGETDMC
jgi:hypothetical protein